MSKAGLLKSLSDVMTFGQLLALHIWALVAVNSAMRRIHAGCQGKQGDHEISG